jgi:hypothetical protein
LRISQRLASADERRANVTPVVTANIAATIKNTLRMKPLRRAVVAKVVARSRSPSSRLEKARPKAARPGVAAEASGSGSGSDAHMLTMRVMDVVSDGELAPVI